MNINNWKIFDKSGSQLNWYSDSHINLSFKTIEGKDAAGYLLTDISGNIIGSEITNSGFQYTSDTSVYYNTIFDNTLIDITDNVDINLVDVSIFNPSPKNTQGIYSIDSIDVSAQYYYPSMNFTSAIFLEPTSVNIIETEHLFVFDVIDGSLFRPFDASIDNLSVQLVGDEDEIQLFTIDEDDNSVIWTDSLTFDVSVYAKDTPISLNIGFKAKEEGVYERSLNFYTIYDGYKYLLAQIVVNAEAIGEDERHRALLGNFGLPDPKDFPKLFKDADINEDLVDYGIVNPKSKQMILDHSEIMPYIGTYKALVNAIKWLGYDDIYIREWFKNVKENKKISLIIPYEPKDRSQTLLHFSPDERRVLKKLNQLSLNYCLTRETGELDDWGMPETENCYEYNLNEVFVKLLSLKNWLEKNIIGVNSRITDITGEGVYFDRFVNYIYATDNAGLNYQQQQSITPITYPTNTELIHGDASINLSLLELTQTRIEDLDQTFGSFIDYVWDPNDPSVTLTPNDASYLANPDSYLAVGPTISHPFVALNDIQWKTSVNVPESAVITSEYVSNPLWIYHNEIKFYDALDSSSVFYDNTTHVNIDNSTKLTILLETAYLRDASNDNWDESITYSIYPDELIRLNSAESVSIVDAGHYKIIKGEGYIIQDLIQTSYTSSELFPFEFDVIGDSSVFVQASTNTNIFLPYHTGYVLEEASTGNLSFFNSALYLAPQTDSLLQYAIDDNYQMPLLKMRNFRTIDANDNIINFGLDKLYNLDIADGQIVMLPNKEPKEFHYIKFVYDPSLYEQQINLNVEYLSPRMPLQIIDPSIYYWGDPSGLSGGLDSSAVVIDNSIHTMNVNHVGEYKIEVFGWDGYNTLFNNSSRDDQTVWIKTPTIYTLIDNSINLDEYNPKTDYMTISEINTLVNNNSKPIYDRVFPLQDLRFEIGSDGKPVIKIPSISYFTDVPQPGSLNKFSNISERVISIDGSVLTIDPDFQSFNTGDDLSIVYFNKSDYNFIEEYETVVESVLNDTITTAIPSSYKVDSSTGVYLLNSTLRATENYNRISDTSFSIDISNYTFRDNQVVNMIIKDVCTFIEQGTSYRVNGDPSGSTHTFDFILPEFVVNDPSRYEIFAKHGFSTYSEFSSLTASATEEHSQFYVNIEDDYRQYLLDNTFIMVNLPFDYDNVDAQWYDPSDNLINSNYYYYRSPIIVDSSTLVLIKSVFDPSSYMIDQKNAWTIRKSLSNEVILKTYNDSIPFIFNETGYYDVIVDSYDSYGNMSNKTHEGLIQVI